MSLVTSTAACNAATNAVTGLLGSGAKLKFRLSGTLGAPGTVVSTLSLSATPFATAVKGVAVANTITADSSATGNASPVATATLETSGGTIVVHFSVAEAGGDLDMTGGLVIAPGDTVTCSRLRYAALVDKTDAMAIGMNVQGNSTSGGAMPFANMMWQALPWVRYSGAGSYTQNQGTLTASVGTDRFYAVISADGISMPSGTYTVLNPDGAKIGIGSSPGGADLAAISTSTSFTFSYTGDVGTGLWIHAEGSVSMASSAIGGGVAIIIPGHTTSWAAGDYFNSAWITFQQGLGTQVLRTMDMTLTNINIDTDWSDRTVANKLTFYGPGGPAVPWEILCAMANRLGRDLWLCVPYRATTSYQSSLASLINTNLNANLKVYIEPMNEAWNFAGAFSAGYYWTMFRTHTRRLCTVNAATGVLTLTSHGFSNAQVAHGWSARSSRTALVDDGDYYGESRGGERWIEVLTTNTFKLHGNSGLTAPVSSYPTGVTELIIINESEAGKPAGDVDGNYGTFCTEVWSAFDTAMGASRVKAVCGSQASGAFRSTARLAVSGVSTRCDHLAIAPYWRGFIFHGVVDSVSGQFTPKLWANGTSASTVHFALYSNGSTPTIAEVKAGTGTGFIHHQSFSQTFASSNAYTSGSAVAVTNTTVYKAYFVVVDSSGYTWSVSGNITASASSFSQNFEDTAANQKIRDLIGIDSANSDENVAGVIAAHKAIATAANPAITMISYEGASHWDEYPDNMPTAMKTYMQAYVETPEYGEVLKYYLSTCAAADMRLFTYYQDCSNSLSWTLCDSITDTSDPRYVAVASFAGAVPKKSQLGFGATVVGSNVLADPNNFPTPTTIYTFSDSTLSYAIVAGNDEGNYRVSGNTVQMINDTGVTWASITFIQLKMTVTDGFTVDTFNLSFGLGPIWFASDANWAWRASDDTSTTAVNPTIGGALPKTAGTDATIVADGWDLGGTGVYLSNNGMTSEAFYSQPFLAIIVARKDDEVSGGMVVTQFGSSDLILFEGIGGIRLDVRWYNGGRGINQSHQIAAPWAAGTMAVYWAYFDAVNLKFYAGCNQTDYSSGGYSYASQGSQRFDKAVQMGTSNAVVKASQSITRSSMTLTQALAEVQAIQTAFGL